MSDAPSRHSRLRRAAVQCSAVALAATSLVLAPASTAQADASNPSLVWEISDRFDEHLSTHVLGDGATEDVDGKITFPGGVGSYDPATGATSMAYQGSVSGSFVFTATTYYTVTIEDPIVTVDDEGDGQISAVVSAWNAAQPPSTPEASTSPSRVVVTTFDATPASWTAGSGIGTLAAAPHWAGVLAADSTEATALGIPTGQPVDGKSFAPSFLGQLTSGVRAHFYASGASSDAKKPPAPISAEAVPAVEEKTVEVETTSASPEGGLTLGVSGTGFTASDGNPGDAGIYAGLAPAGGLPDVSSQEGMASFAAAAWVQPNQIVDGQFATSLTAPTDKLDPETSYSVYTWRAHSHSTTSQDTETPVTIDWTALEAAASTVTPSGTTSKRFGQTATLTAQVSGPGSVTLTGVGPAQTTDVDGGQVSFTVPAGLAVGGYTARFAYSGNAAHQPSEATRPLAVTKATPTLSSTWKRKPSPARTAKLEVLLRGPVGVTQPGGQVLVKLKRLGVTHQVTGVLTNGKVVVKLPKVAAGTWKLTVRYGGAGNYTGAETKKVVTASGRGG